LILCITKLCNAKKKLEYFFEALLLMKKFL